jgi:hypothetical protein
MARWESSDEKRERINEEAAENIQVIDRMPAEEFKRNLLS